MIHSEDQSTVTPERYLAKRRALYALNRGQQRLRLKEQYQRHKAKRKAARRARYESERMALGKPYKPQAPRQSGLATDELCRLCNEPIQIGKPCRMLLPHIRRS